MYAGWSAVTLRAGGDQQTLLAAIKGGTNDKTAALTPLGTATLLYFRTGLRWWSPDITGGGGGGGGSYGCWCPVDPFLMSRRGDGGRGWGGVPCLIIRGMGAGKRLCSEVQSIMGNGHRGDLYEGTSLTGGNDHANVILHWWTLGLPRTFLFRFDSIFFLPS